MSQKQAKRLRKAALGLVVALEQAGRTIQPNALLAKEHRRAVVPGSEHNPKLDGDQPDQEQPEQLGKLYAISAVNRPDSLRGIIRTIKKGMKSGVIPSLPSGQVPVPTAPPNIV